MKNNIFAEFYCVVVAAVLVGFSPTQVRGFGLYSSSTTTASKKTSIIFCRAQQGRCNNSHISLYGKKYPGFSPALSLSTLHGGGGGDDTGSGLSSLRQQKSLNSIIRLSLVNAFIFASVSSSSVQLATAASPPPSPPTTTITQSFTPAAATTSTESSLSSPFVFNHNYADPLHPECKRKIEVNKDSLGFHYSGTGVGPKDDPVLRGCTPSEIREYGIRRGAFDGKILPGLKLDAGDGIHVGVWEPAAVATRTGPVTATATANGDTTTIAKYADVGVDGIRWNDGNKWIVQEESVGSVAGKYFFVAYIGFSGLAGVKGAVDLFKRNRQEQQQ